MDFLAAAVIVTLSFGIGAIGARAVLESLFFVMRSAVPRPSVTADTPRHS